MNNDKASNPDKAGNVGRRSHMTVEAVPFMLIPQNVDFTNTKHIKYMMETVPARNYLDLTIRMSCVDCIAKCIVRHCRWHLPRALNFVKNVVVLKLSIGNTSNARNNGTVRYRSQAGPKLSYVRSCFNVLLIISSFGQRTVGE